MMLSSTAVVFALAGAFATLPAALGLVAQKRAAAFFDPTAGGGSMLIDAGNGLGEPLNVIISGLSSPQVLNEDGLINYARAIGFSTECFGIHLGNPFSANLGDGHGPVNQTTELRQDFGNADLGTCLESLVGGNHFRVYFQNGPSADSGAAFLAVSREEPASDNHDIVPDGYDIGRDQLVAGAVGITSFDGVTYSTTAQNVTGLLPVGSAGVNHGTSTGLRLAPTFPSTAVDDRCVPTSGIAIDGIVTVLTVTIQ
ncbi:hypothetical protein BN946_scf184796.g16 [Trametes cinnabarina]|uniref:Uncharacterized protein n=1 Tax=Pycnoporus cinnabarinus TaxID=5643 RepID=A0A060SQ97_PYCCI|nr:hypothetical protein BN946_scf184796.g16 [Trametes cinnabarina]